MRIGLHLGRREKAFRRAAPPGFKIVIANQILAFRAAERSQDDRLARRFFIAAGGRHGEIFIAAHRLALLFLVPELLAGIGDRFVLREYRCVDLVRLARLRRAARQSGRGQ